MGKEHALQIPIAPSSPARPDRRQNLIAPGISGVAGNLATQRAATGSSGTLQVGDPMMALPRGIEDFSGSVDPNVSSLRTLGPDAESHANLKTGSGQQGLTGKKQSWSSYIDVGAQGSRGSLASHTEFLLEYDPGDPTGLALDTKAPPSPKEIQFKEISLYPVVLHYTRNLQIHDATGRDCTVTINGVVSFSRETFYKEIGLVNRLDLNKLINMRGEAGMMNVATRGSGKLANYLGNYKASYVGQVSLAMESAAAEANFSGEGQQLLLKSTKPAAFIQPKLSAGEQFDGLEEFLSGVDTVQVGDRVMADLKGLEGDPNTPSVSGKSKQGSGEVRAGEHKGEKDDEQGAIGKFFSRIWNGMPEWARGIIEGVASFVMKASLVIGAIALAAAVIAGIVAFFIPGAFAAVFATAFTVIGLTVFAGFFGLSVYIRSKEAKASGGASIFKILGVAFLDAIGLSGVIQAGTDKSLLSNKPFHRTLEERWKAGTEGVFQTALSLLGLRAALKGKAPSPADEPDAPPAPPRTPAKLADGFAARARPAEVRTAERLIQDPAFDGRTFEAPPPPDPGYDWTDDLGRTYDAMGDGTKAEYFKLQQFTDAIDSHLLKRNDFTVIDMTGYTPEQVTAVTKYVNGLPPASQAMIRKVGF